jgi:hypothetical protein
MWFCAFDLVSLFVAVRYLDPMGLLMINLGFVLGMGTKIGYKLVKG